MKKRISLLPVLLVGFALLALAASVSASALDEAPEGMFIPLELGEILPCMVLNDQDGLLRDVSQALEENKSAPGPVVLLFWSAFCPNCHEVIPAVANFAKENNLCFWAINVDGEQFSNAVGAYLKNNNLELHTVYDRLEGEYLIAADPLGVSKTPTLYLADATGRVILHQEIKIDLKVARAALTQLK